MLKAALVIRIIRPWSDKMVLQLPAIFRLAAIYGENSSISKLIARIFIAFIAYSAV